MSDEPLETAVRATGPCVPAGGESVPRTIWCLWLQGMDAAPPVVRRCIASWQEYNLAWSVRCLDQSTVGEFITFDPTEPALRHLNRAQLSDVIRLDLLAHWGGVWADATCLCTKPLDAWLPQCMTAGFFAFRRPARDRLLSNWFLAAHAGHPLVILLFHRLLGYWRRNAFDAPGNRLITKVLNALLSHTVATTRLWFSPVVARGLRVYPYFAFHYLFAELVATDDALRELWARVPEWSAAGPHRLQRSGLLEPLDGALDAWLESRATPVHKLTWKLDVSEPPSGSVLERAFEVARTGTP